MVQGNTRSEADPGWKSKEIESQVMDFHYLDAQNGVPIGNRYYASTIRETGLEPTASSSYACRWIHLTQGPLTFDEFLLIVHDLLLKHSKREQDNILSGLRKFQRRYQLKGSYGPSFRPSFVPLRDAENIEDSSEWSDSTAEHPNLPAFLSIPCIHFETPVSRPPDNTFHHSKTLSQYHYRFGKPDLTNRAHSFDIISTLREEESPHVRELWCLAIDDKNLLTSSSLAAPNIWPVIDQGSETSDGMGLSTSAKMALRQHFKHDLKRIIGLGTKDISYVIAFSRWVTMLTATGPSFLLSCSTLEPVLWLLLTIFRNLDPDVRAVDSVAVVGLFSFSDMIAQSKGENKNEAYGWLQMLIPFTRLRVQRHSRSIAPRLCAMSTHVQHWIQIEKIARVQADPSDEIFNTLRKLWSIAVRFTTSFYMSQDHLYDLNQTSFWKKIFNRKRPLRADEVQLKSDGSKKPWGTLRDLEKEFVDAIATLERQQGSKMLDIQAAIHRENEDLLRFVHKFDKSLSLACLFHMCIISTPTRFSITSRDITDMFATTTSNLEWLIRDSVSQPLVYQISAVAEDLRIVKDVLQSQTQVTFAVAKNLARLLGMSKTINDTGKGMSSTTGNLKQAEDHASQQSREAYTFKILQRRLQFRHRHLNNDIERLAETAERLKVQAALLINIKAEDKNVAIFIFTVVTVVFLPLSFVTSYLGMNTSDIRDMEQGQWLFWAIGGAVTIVTLLVACVLAFRGPEWKRARQNYRLSILADSKWE